MSIDRTFYQKEIMKAILLMQANVSQETADAWFKEIERNFENSDLQYALRSIQESETRLTFNGLFTALNASACMRRERSVAREKEAERRDNDAFWSGSAWRNRAHGECDHHCLPCPVKECPKIALDSVKAIYDIIDRKRTLAQVNIEMAEKYIGWGELNE